MPTTSPANGSLLDTRSLTREDIHSIFKRADQLAAFGRDGGNFYESGKPPRLRTIALVFFEPSTRTRISFQVAASRLGYQTVAIEPAASSLSKGETYVDTVLNIAAMKPDKMVIRYGQSAELDRCLPQLPMPIINAGSGTDAHPTQALLDAYTILKERGRLEGERVLIVGDIRHSRVARSNFDVLTKLGCEIGICGPEKFLPEDSELQKLGLRVFKKLDDAATWASVYMGLRIQLERHDGAEAAERLAQYRREYHENFGLTAGRLRRLADDAIIMHPGPINHGVEFSDEVVNDGRARVMKQVENGVPIRAAILA